MRRLEEEIPIITCQLEMYFPPSFFDPMEHLPIHLAYEARIAGPVHYRWMYPCERFLGKLKRTARNKSHVEASIINAYLTEEASSFSSIYFEPHLQTKRSKIGRHDDGGEIEYVPWESFYIHSSGSSAGKCVRRWLNGKEYKAARRYILTNCKEMATYISMFEDEMYGDGWATNTVELEECIENHFVPWFENYVAKDHSNVNNNEFLISLAQGPLKEVKTYPIYFVNGFVFHTKKHGSNRKTANSGVCIKGTCDYTNQSLANDYYGMLAEVIELEYNISSTKTVLFNCDWFNMSPSHMQTDKHGLVSINSKGNYPKYDPFILASQATQVCYLPYPTFNGKKSNEWWAVCKVKARSVIHLLGSECQIEKIAYQDEDQPFLSITDDDYNLRTVFPFLMTMRLGTPRNRGPDYGVRIGIGAEYDLFDDEVIPEDTEY